MISRTCRQETPVFPIGPSAALDCPTSESLGPPVNRLLHGIAPWDVSAPSICGARPAFYTIHPLPTLGLTLASRPSSPIR